MKVVSSTAARVRAQWFAAFRTFRILGNEAVRVDDRPRDWLLQGDPSCRFGHCLTQLTAPFYWSGRTRGVRFLFSLLCLAAVLLIPLLEAHEVKLARFAAHSSLEASLLVALLFTVIRAAGDPQPRALKGQTTIVAPLLVEVAVGRDREDCMREDFIEVG
eukprot:1367822-Amphidinium_carterae.1